MLRHHAISPVQSAGRRFAALAAAWPAGIRGTSCPRVATVLRALVSAVPLILLPAGVALAFPDGPPDGFAGNPPDGFDCTQCHYDHPANSGDGSLEISGLPTEYTPGQTYLLAVRIEDPGQSRWGFEMTVLDDTNPNDDFNDGGTLEVVDAVHTQISEDSYGTLDFLKQTTDGTYPNTPDGPVEWAFSWTAPTPETTSITFYLAGNAADGDGSFVGDWIYTQVRTLYPENPVGATSGTWGAIKSLFRR